MSVSKLLAPTLAPLMLACASASSPPPAAPAPAPAAAESAAPDAPAWTTKGQLFDLSPTNNPLLCAVGSSPKMADASMARGSADRRARAEMAKAVAAVQAAGGAPADAPSPRTFSGIQIRDHHTDAVGITYALACLDLDESLQDAPRAFSDLKPAEAKQLAQLLRQAAEKELKLPPKAP